MKINKIIVAAVGVIAGVAAIFGIVTAVRKTTKNTEVMVVPAADLNYGYGYYGEESLEGFVTASVAQNVYVPIDMTISELAVSDGQDVKKGDVLLVYDQGQAELNLARERLNKQQIEMNIEIAERNIRVLKNLTPVEDIEPELPDEPIDIVEPDEPFEPVEPIEPETPEETVPPTTTAPAIGMFDLGTEVKALDDFDASAEAWSDSSKAAGTYENPYRYLATDGAKIHGAFFTMLKNAASDKPLFFVIEIREGDSPTGNIRKIWIQDASQLPSLEDDWVGTFSTDTELSGNSEDSENVPVNAGGAAALGAVRFSVTPAVKMRWRLGGALFDPGRAISADSAFTEEEIEIALREEEETLRTLRLDLREAELKVKAAEDAAAKNTVTAKMDGVAQVRGTAEHPPQDGSPLITVSAQQGQYVIGALPESKLTAVHEGDIVRVMSWQSGSMREAVVTEISPYPDDSGRFYMGGNESFYPFTSIIGDGGEQLGEQEYVQIFLDDQAETPEDNAFYLWKAFIREDEGQKYAYVRGEDGLLEKREIVTGRQAGEGTEIVSGVTVEDWIAFPYGSEVRDGAKTREGSISDLYNY